MLSGINCKCKGDGMATEPLLSAPRHHHFRLPGEPDYSPLRYAWNRPVLTTRERTPAVAYTAGTWHGYKFARQGERRRDGMACGAVEIEPGRSSRSLRCSPLGLGRFAAGATG